MQSLQFALTNAHAGRAVLFVGSGFATEATNVQDEQMPTGAGFRANLARAVRVDETTELDRIAQLFAKDFSEHNLIDTVIKTFTTKDVSTNQLDILSVQWREIYTTNYDNVVETASAQLNRAVSPITFFDPLPRVNQTPRCIHLNGYIGRIRTLRDIRLTTASYAAVSLNASPWATRLRRSLSNAGSVFFVGYSVYDLDITRILREDPAVRDKTHFFNGPNPDRVTQATIEPFGQIHDLGISELATAIKMSKPSIFSEPAPFFTSFEVCTIDDTTEKPGDDDVFNLLVKGHLNRGKLATALADDEVDNYLVYREGAQRALDILEGEADVLLHANIGNGKTVCTDIITTELCRRNITVFTYKKITSSVQEELDFIKSVEGEKAVIIENADRNLKIIQDLLAERDTATRLVATIRTATYDLRQLMVQAVLGNSYREIDLNRLSRNEAGVAVRLLDRYGLWGVRAAQPSDRKIEYVISDCGGEIRGLVLALLHSEVVQARLKAAVSALRSADSPTFEVLLASCFLSVDERATDLDVISELLDQDVFRVRSGEVRALLHEFVELSSARVLLKSPVLAEHILTELADRDEVIELLIQIVQRLDNIASDQEYGQIMRSFSRFSYVDRILPAEGKRERLIKFYENIKHLSMCNSNPQFWMQYAIARMSFEDYGRANTYFESAYSFAAKIPNYDTYQLDNHYARLLLESRTKSHQYDDYFIAFVKANRLLSKQMEATAQGYYPYRVARLYADFIRVRGSTFDNSQLATFESCCERVIKRIAGASRSLLTYPVVGECRERMVEALSRAASFKSPSS